MLEKALTKRLRKAAHRLGFDAVGVAPAVTPPGIARFDEWLGRGYAGEMSYLADRRDAYEHPSQLLEGARSVVVLTLDYRTAEPAKTAEWQGRVARYAWGDIDYHDLIRPRLHALADALRDMAPGATTRGVVDTAPLLERDFAALSGLGWIGKNTLLLSKERGSYFFLAALVTDAELEYDAPTEIDHCGTCTACLDACPTDAFVAPRVLDASKCISYLTIEAKEMPPQELRQGMGEWLFGCDVCQDVCPWNRFSQTTDESAFAPRTDCNPIDLLELFRLDEEAFRLRFRSTPLWRSRRRGLLRNAAIVLGNTRPSNGEQVLVLALEDKESLVRAAAAWALGQYGAVETLGSRLNYEADAMVREEIQAALARASG